MATGAGQTLGPAAAEFGPSRRHRAHRHRGPDAVYHVPDRVRPRRSTRWPVSTGPCWNATWPGWPPSPSATARKRTPSPRREPSSRRSASTAGTTACRPRRCSSPATCRLARPESPATLAEHVMAQVEAAGQPRPLAHPRGPADHHHPDPMRAARHRRLHVAPSTACSTTGSGAPYLRYFNHKMRREAAVPIDEELESRDPRPAAAGRRAAGPSTTRTCSPR